MNIQWSVSLEKHIYRQLHILRLKKTAEYAMEDGPGERILWPTSYLTTVKYMKKQLTLIVVRKLFRLENKYLMR